jgi:hypothetical protein
MKNEQLMGLTHYRLGGGVKQGVLLTNPAFDMYKWPCLLLDLTCERTSSVCMAQRTDAALRS